VSQAKQACLAVGAGFATPARSEQDHSLISWFVLAACVTEIQEYPPLAMTEEFCRSQTV